jgi:competence protein ComEC
MGDAEKPLENYLVSLEGSRLKADVLKIGHHGSSKSTSEGLLGFSSPEYAVISVGKDNSYGHPHKETLEILNRFGIKILRTDELGTIKIKSDGINIALE